MGRQWLSSFFVLFLFALTEERPCKKKRPFPGESSLHHWIKDSVLDDAVFLPARPLSPFFEAYLQLSNGKQDAGVAVPGRGKFPHCRLGSENKRNTVSTIDEFITPLVGYICKNLLPSHYHSYSLQIPRPRYRRDSSGLRGAVWCQGRGNDCIFLTLFKQTLSALDSPTRMPDSHRHVFFSSRILLMRFVSQRPRSSWRRKRIAQV